MKLDSLELIQFLPVFMREDKTAQGFAYAVQNQLGKVVDAAVKAQIYANVDTLAEIILDELAWQFSVPEYDPTLDPETKRRLIKTCMATHKTRGTAGAVEKVIDDIFGDGYVEEWYQYSGSPYHFRVVTSNASVTGELANTFITAVEKVKRGSAVMDTVIVDLSAQLTAYYATALHIGDFYTAEMVV